MIDEAAAFDEVIVSREGRVLRVRLNRPAKRNALTSDMVDALREAVAAAEADSVAVIVIEGAEGFFSAGADIAGYRDAAQNAAALSDFTNRAKALCVELTTARAIVIAAVDGVAMGGGFEIVLSADLVVATRRSRFGLPEVTLGLIPGWGGTQRLTRHLGPNRTKRAVLLGEPVTTAEAYEAGIVTHVAPPEDLAALVDEIAGQLAARAPLALAAAKAAITAAVDPTAGDDAGSALETRLLLDLFASEDGREGVAAFTEKRGPVFVGR